MDPVVRKVSLVLEVRPDRQDRLGLWVQLVHSDQADRLDKAE
jgi:hypothetical protein